MKQSKLFRVLALVLVVVAFLLACRTAQLLSGNLPARNVSNLRNNPTETATRARARPTATPFDASQPPPPVGIEQPTLPVDAPPQAQPTSVPPPQVMPTDLPQPPPVDQPTRPPVDPLDDSYTGLSANAPTSAPTPVANAPVPTPDGTPVADGGSKTCPQTYCVVYRGCETDSGNTIIEGYVYNNGVPENGIPVRAALEEGGYPLVEFVSGTDPINPGQPDPKNPGRYILQIVAGEAREGNWWVFAVDVPNGTKRISESKLIHTNDDPFTAGNCQHAYVDFVR